MEKLKFYGDALITGPGSILGIGDLEGERFFIVTGRSSMFKNGTMKKVEALLKDKVYEIYSGIGGNPSTDEVEAGLRKMKDFNPDVVLAIGGGSAIDAAKVMTLLCEYKDLTIKDIKEGKVPRKREKIKLVAIPSTSGTATEVTKVAVLTFKEDNIKIGLKTPAFIPDIGILDGNLTLSMPDHVMAESGMDALTHALEAYINENADDFTKTMAWGAAVGLIKHLRDSFEKKDINSRQHVHNFQSLAGFAFQNAGLGMNHGIAHAFGGRFGTSHGLLNAVGLPYVLMYNAKSPRVAKDLEMISKMIGKDIIEEVIELNNDMGIPKSFKEAGILEEEFLKYYESLLENSLKGSTVKNPILMDAVSMDKVLKSVYYGKILF